jgi:hypothetical protein
VVDLAHDLRRQASESQEAVRGIAGAIVSGPRV